MLSQSDLNQFTGTTRYYRHWLRRFVYTEGIDYVADKGRVLFAGCDRARAGRGNAIASNPPELLKDRTQRRDPLGGRGRGKNLLKTSGTLKPVNCWELRH